MTIRLLGSDLHIHNIQTRMPFKYGIATLTVVPHLFARVHVEVDGTTATGIAADSLPPKWFTKDPTTSMQHDIAEMIDVIQAACRHADTIGTAGSPFACWQQLYAQQKVWAEARTALPAYPPLLWNFGVTLVERALIDAFCRAKGMTFHQALHTNALGIELGTLHPTLAGTAPTDFLPSTPRQTLIARHTIGLLDPLTDDEIEDTERVDDGLPQSFAACIRHYSLTHFKIKVGGNVAEDLARLARIIAVIEAHVSGAYAFTLDGNEQYKNIGEFRAFWDALCATFPRFVERLIFVEQPLHRDIALSDAVGTALAAWPDRPPMIIDESDGSLESLPTALALGYQGTSHKNCKGIFKGIANACLITHLQRQIPERQFLLSGEDLTNIGPVALLQDLAVLATLGVDHAERNGHHYYAGLSIFPERVQQQVLTHHPDLYRRQDDLIAVAIDQGKMALRSVTQAPFGVGFDLDVAQFVPLERWTFASLGVT
ncbi:MAG TPA: hypothetical protein P5121_32645 [Caldilineaceae bacterium]|nr:hypothetical protein [Caldilineaceae bacterium]